MYLYTYGEWSRYNIGRGLSSSSSYCSMPTGSNPTSPLDCYNYNGDKLRSWVDGKWVQDNATLSFCPGNIMYIFFLL